MKNLQRILSGLTSPLGLILVILFFLPWIEISCQNTRAATQTGWELTTGNATPAAAPATKAKAETKKDNGPDARWWCIAGLLIPLAMTFVGARALLRPVVRNTGLALALLGAAGLIVTIMAANTDYASEILADMRQQQAAQQQQPQQQPNFNLPPEAFAAAISTTPQAALWISMALHVVVLLCGTIAMAVGRLSSPTAELPLAQPLPPE